MPSRQAPQDPPLGASQPRSSRRHATHEGCEWEPHLVAAGPPGPYFEKEKHPPVPPGPEGLLMAPTSTFPSWLNSRTHESGLPAQLDDSPKRKNAMAVESRKRVASPPPRGCSAQQGATLSAMSRLGHLSLGLVGHVSGRRSRSGFGPQSRRQRRQSPPPLAACTPPPNDGARFEPRALRKGSLVEHGDLNRWRHFDMLRISTVEQVSANHRRASNIFDPPTLIWSLCETPVPLLFSSLPWHRWHLALRSAMAGRTGCSTTPPPDTTGISTPTRR